PRCIGTEVDRIDLDEVEVMPAVREAAGGRELYRDVRRHLAADAAEQADRGAHFLERELPKVAEIEVETAGGRARDPALHQVIGLGPRDLGEHVEPEPELGSLEQFAGVRGANGAVCAAAKADIADRGKIAADIVGGRDPLHLDVGLDVPVEPFERAETGALPRRERRIRGAGTDQWLDVERVIAVALGVRQLDDQRSAADQETDEGIEGDEVVRAPRGIGRGLVAVALDESLKCPRQPGLAEADRAGDDPFAPLRLRLVVVPGRSAPGREASAPLPVLVLVRRWDDLAVRHIAGVSTKRTATLIIEKVVGPFGDFGHRLLEGRTIALLLGSLRAAQESFD